MTPSTVQLHGRAQHGQNAQVWEAGDGVCPGWRVVLLLPLQNLASSPEFTGPLCLLASLTCTTLVTLSVRQPISCHFKDVVERQAIQ